MWSCQFCPVGGSPAFGFFTFLFGSPALETQTMHDEGRMYVCLTSSDIPKLPFGVSLVERSYSKPRKNLFVVHNQMGKFPKERTSSKFGIWSPDQNQSEVISKYIEIELRTRSVKKCGCLEQD